MFNLLIATKTAKRSQDHSAAKAVRDGSRPLAWGVSLPRMMETFAAPCGGRIRGPTPPPPLGATARGDPSIDTL